MASVCVDVLGGDYGPNVVLEGIELALATSSSLSVVLAGPKDICAPFCDAHERTEALIAEQTIAMDEHPTQAVRAKRDSTIVKGCKACAEGEADAFFSAGSTGAVLAAATLFAKRIHGVIRPAIAAVLPSPTQKNTVLLDLGANADCRPDMIVQFGVMGSILSRLKGFSDSPLVSLLSNGEEDSKGSELSKTYFDALTQACKDGELLFAGNCEGSDLLTGEKDVIVADGFTANIAVKSVEGAARFIAAMLKKSAGVSPVAALGCLCIKKPVTGIIDAISGTEHGGAMLLGLRAPVFIGHGKSTPIAIKQGILAAEQCAQDKLCERIQEAIERKV